jgi:hypothetical protein
MKVSVTVNLNYIRRELNTYCTGISDCIRRDEFLSTDKIVSKSNTVTLVSPRIYVYKYIL